MGQVRARREEPPDVVEMAGEESFPASDPPPWTLGVRQEEEEPRPRLGWWIGPVVGAVLGGGLGLVATLLLGGRAKAVRDGSRRAA